MRSLLLAGAAIVAFGAGPVMAACTTTYALTATQITTLLATGNTACIHNSCSGSGSSNWAHYATEPDNETMTGGAVYDYKQGPTNATDWSSQVGTYTITGTTPGTVTYTYTGDSHGPYSYNVIAPTFAPTVTAASWGLGTATLTFTAQSSAPLVGATVVVAGVGRSGYDGTFTVTASSTTTVSYAVAFPGGSSSGGTATYGYGFTSPAAVNYTFCNTGNSNLLTVSITHGSP